MTNSLTRDRDQLNGMRILIVEDHVDSAEVLGDLLKLVGATVAVAQDGSQALEVAKAFEPEVVVLDLGLPEMHGGVVAERLREQAGPQKTLRIIAVTGYGRQDPRGRVAAEGFFAYFVKPVALEQLVQAIRAP